MQAVRFESYAIIICCPDQLKQLPTIRTHLPAGWLLRGWHGTLRAPGGTHPGAASQSFYIYRRLRQFAAPPLYIEGAVFCRRQAWDLRLACPDTARTRNTVPRAPAGPLALGLTPRKSKCHYQLLTYGLSADGSRSLQTAPSAGCPDA